MSEQNNRLILIDGNSIAYRAFFALPPLTNAQGQQTNAVYGFVQMLWRILQNEKPTHIAVAFDAGKHNFRHDLFTDYKGTRQKTPSELSEQFPLLRELLQVFSIPSIEIPGFEADDIIGTLAALAEKDNLNTLVVSGDKDLLQLVSPIVHAALTRKGVTEVDYYDPEAVRARFGLDPLQIIDLKGLMGDSSDNIPGVPGVGEKTAVKLLQAYSSVEEVLAHIEDISGNKLKERLTEHRDLAKLSKELATIHREVPVTASISDLRYEGYDVEKVIPFFRHLGFKSLIDKISREMTNESAEVETDPVPKEDMSKINYSRISDRDGLAKMLSKLTTTVGVVPDLTDNDYQVADFRGFAVASKQGAFYISFENELELTDLKDLWSAEYEKVVFDLKSLVVSMDAHGITLREEDEWFDAMLAAYLLNPSEGELSLRDVAERELNTHLPTEKETEEQDREALLCRYAMALPELKKPLVSGMSAQEVDDLYSKVELPLTFVLARMEILGFYMNADRLRSFGKELTEKLAELTKQIFHLAGVEFNINSPKQLGEILFEKLGLPAHKKTKTGYSTSADVLEKLAPYHEVVERILEYRQLGKLQSTYIDGLLKVIRKETGRVHTRFHQALTATGRLSSSEPNMQNIPIRLEEGRRLRQVFEPTYKDWLIMSADYSQVELRILAHLSGDEALIDAFRQGIDIHTRTAADVFEVPIDEVTPLMRRQAKAVNFGIVYGISDFGLARNLNIPRKEAAKFIEGYFGKFPGVERYMKEIVSMAKKDGYVTTLLNRRRYLPDIHSKNFNLRSFAERTAMNTPIQGTAADIIKLAMVTIDKALMVDELQARMLLQVHDELIFEFPKSELETLTNLVKENMENAMTLNVPLQVDIHVGQTWYEAK
jgi:DNA polymerase I